MCSPRVPCLAWPLPQPDEAPVVDLGTEAFRRQPNGRDALGACYYILDFLRASGGWLGVWGG